MEKIGLIYFINPFGSDYQAFRITEINEVINSINQGNDALCLFRGIQEDIFRNRFELKLTLTKQRPRVDLGMVFQELIERLGIPDMIKDNLTSPYNIEETLKEYGKRTRFSFLYPWRSITDI